MVTGYALLNADRAFGRANRARARARLTRRLGRRLAEADGLRVFEPHELSRTGAAPSVFEIPLAAIAGTLEPGRARLFDRCHRPARAARTRWLGVWMAEQRGVALPPISVSRVGDEYGIRDGHHRVSVAVARGAVSIDATVH
jgi:hypothetical protein